MKRKDIERVHNGYLERKTWKPFEDVVEFSYAFTIHSDLLNKLSDKASEKEIHIVIESFIDRKFKRTIES